MDRENIRKTIHLFHYNRTESKGYDEYYYHDLSKGYSLCYERYIKNPYGGRLTLTHEDKIIFQLDSDEPTEDRDRFLFLVKLKACKDIHDSIKMMIEKYAENFKIGSGLMIPSKMVTYEFDS